MRATLHLISAGLLGLSAAGSFLLAVKNSGDSQSVDFELVFATLYTLAAIANLIYAFKD